MPKNVSLRLISIVAMVTILAIASAPSMRRAWVAKKNTEDFAPTYRAAQAMWNHQDIREATSGIYLYSPFVAFIFQPLTVFPEHTAALIWIVLGAALLATASVVAAKELGRRWKPWFDGGDDGSMAFLIAAAVLLISYDKVHAEFRLMQIDALLFLGFALILPWMDRKSFIGGLIVGAVGNVKYLALIFVPYFLIKRNYRAALGSIGGFFFFMMLPAVEVGFRLVGHYAADSLTGLAKLANLTARLPNEGLRILPINWDRSISFTSAIFRATNARGMSDLVVDGLVLLAVTMVIGAIFIIARKRDVWLFWPVETESPQVRGARVSLEWAALIGFALMFSPQIMARHMLLLSLVYILGLTLLIAARETRLRIALIVAILIAVAGLAAPFRAFGLRNLLQSWRAMAGASWCALLLILVVTWTGAELISKRQVSEGTPINSDRNP